MPKINPNQELIDLLRKRRLQMMTLFPPKISGTPEDRLIEKVIFLLNRAATELERKK